MSTKLVLPFAEVMLTQACNIACVGCTNYSDLSHKGWLSWHDGMKQLLPWLDRIDIPDFGIIGGEPLLNPEVRQWIKGLRNLLPDTQLRFSTNGLLLAKNLDVIDLCHDVGNVVFKITKHINDNNLDNVIDKIKSKFDWEPVTQYGINRWRTSNNLRLQINQPTMFIKTFVGNYENMRPHHSNPSEAFSICCQQTCPLLYKGKLFKCSTTALLEDVLIRFNNPNYKEWKTYLNYGLGPDCNDNELINFVNNFGKSHSMCSQCPTSNNKESQLIHFENVSFKKYA
jgi:organic radical activating enzyme